MDSLVQDDHPLLLRHLLDRMRFLYGDAEVVTLVEDGVERSSYREVVDRVERVCSLLRDLGVRPGDRVATFCWNTQRHLELYLAVPAMGAVLHTLNIRLSEEQLRYIIEHAGDKLVFVDPSLVDTLGDVAVGSPTIERQIALDDDYEAMLAGAAAEFEFPSFDDRSAAALCFTSGTTGRPKGVLYSHRSNMLHALAASIPNACDIRHGDRAMPVVPMFHANAWGFPYSCPLNGASLVLPSRYVNGPRLAEAIESEKVTISAGVPTIWMDMLAAVEDEPRDLSSLRSLICGGAAVPESLMRRYQEELGVRIFQLWGMTETSPVAASSRPLDDEEADYPRRARQGQPLPFLDIRVLDDEGVPLAWDDKATGELEIRGPWIASGYYDDASANDKFREGWLRTGDIVAVDEEGSVRISDRAKDVIKSGGEWISSVDVENALMAHPDVKEAAVIGVPDERWSERPLACVVPRGESIDTEALREHLAGQMPRWWVPERFEVIAEVPRTSVGKFDKKVLRARFQ